MDRFCLPHTRTAPPSRCALSLQGDAAASTSPSDDSATPPLPRWSPATPLGSSIFDTVPSARGDVRLLLSHIRMVPLSLPPLPLSRWEAALITRPSAAMATPPAPTTPFVPPVGLSSLIGITSPHPCWREVRCHTSTEPLSVPMSSSRCDAATNISPLRDTATPPYPSRSPTCPLGSVSFVGGSLVVLKGADTLDLSHIYTAPLLTPLSSSSGAPAASMRPSADSVTPPFEREE
mmetsp:Transcript_2501/g.5236  ORF Transcript_2501/g.5236 Transcript_2501/m.5236 type:complete len:234 (+) Transcript_2501:705-1406(+)